MTRMSSVRIAVVATIAALLLAISAAAQSVVNTTIFTPPGITNNVGFDFEVAVVESTGLVYVGTTGAYGSDVGVIDPSTNTLISAVALPTNAILDFAIANQTTGLIYFRDQLSSTIVVIDGRPTSPTFNQALPSLNLLPGLVTSFALDETRGLLYVINQGGIPTVFRQVTIIDVNPASATFHQVLDNVLFPPNVSGNGLAVNSATNEIYVGLSGGGGGLYVLNGATRSLSLVAGSGGAPIVGVVVNESANLIYATRSPGNLNQLIAVDGATHTTLATIAMPEAVGSGALGERLAMNADTGRVYLLSSNASAPDKVIVVDGNRASPSFNTVLAAIGVGRRGAGLAVDESLNRVVAASFIDKSTSIIDASSNTVIATIPSTQIPSDVALNRVTHRAYVTNQLNLVQAINVGANSLEATIVTAAEASRGVVSPANHLFYVGRTAVTTDVQLFDKDGIGGTVAGLPHDSGRYVFLALNANTNRIYAENQSANLSGTSFLPGFISVIDGSTNAVIANVEVGNQPFGLALNQVTNKVYVSNAGLPGLPGGRGITVIDGATNAAVSADTSAFPTDAAFAGEVTVNEASNKVYFQLQGGAPTTIGVLDGSTNVATPLPSSLGPVRFIRVNKVLNRVYIVTPTGLLHVLDGATDTEIATLVIGLLANIAVDETTGRVFVTNSAQNMVSVFDGTNNSFVAQIAVGSGPRGVSVNEMTNRVYVGNQDDKTLTIIDGQSLTVKTTLALTLEPNHLSVDPALSRVYVSTIDAKERTGIVVISDAAGTGDALRRALVAATAGAPPGIRNSLMASLDGAQASLAQGNLGAAINKLQALANKVEAQRGKALTNADADRILALISTLVNSVS